MPISDADMTIMVFWTLAILCAIYFIVSQLFKVNAISNIAKKHNIKTNVLTIMPFLNNIHIFTIANKSCEIKGKIKFFKIVFIILSSLAFVFVFLIPAVIVGLMPAVPVISILWLLLVAVSTIMYVVIWPVLIVVLVIYYIIYLYYLYCFYKIEKPKQRWLFLVLSALTLDWLMLFICGVSNKKAVDENSTEQIPQLLPDITEPREKE